ncbi:MAG: nitroreductase family protein [Deltaproteobacteria bacterium]|nr:nitroreductase family protein [Deltaproteobacteria bacterium]MBW2208632.1 nitroreductase family protein [Deltaproteobacteria bacterium]
MDFYEVIEKRRSIRVCKQGATEEQLRKIILAGTKAPSAVNRQPWEFIIVEDQGMIDQLAELKYQLNRKKDPDRGDNTDEELEKGALRQKRYFRNTSLVAVCNEVEWERSVWLSIENMSLAAVAEGLGSCIVLLWGEEKAMAEELLGLPGNYELTALLKIGVPGEKGLAPDKNPWAPRRPEFSWLHKNRFGNRD